MTRAIDIQSFGFLGDVFVYPSLIAKLNLTDGLHLKANAIKTYNNDKNQWGWKLFSLSN
jgi:hypothetical protein